MGLGQDVEYCSILYWVYISPIEGSVPKFHFCARLIFFNFTHLYFNFNTFMKFPRFQLMNVKLLFSVFLLKFQSEHLSLETSNVRSMIHKKISVF
jgi:hypothetical protein